MRKKPLLQTDEQRREAIYRSLGRVRGWEEAFRIRYEHWRGEATKANIGGSGASAYLSGRADSWEEISEIIKISKRTKLSELSDNE